MSDVIAAAREVCKALGKEKYCFIEYLHLFKALEAYDRAVVEASASPDEGEVQKATAFYELHHKGHSCPDCIRLILANYWPGGVEAEELRRQGVSATLGSVLDAQLDVAKRLMAEDDVGTDPLRTGLSALRERWRLRKRNRDNGIGRMTDMFGCSRCSSDLKSLRMATQE